MVEQLAASSREHVASVVSTLKQFSLDDVITFAFAHQMHDYNDFVESRDTGFESALEFMVYTSLFSEARSLDNVVHLKWGDLEAALERAVAARLNSQFAKWSHADVADQVTQSDENEATAYLMDRLIAYFNHVRGDSYPLVTHSILEALFGSIGPMLKSLLGFTYQELCRIFDAMHDSINGSRKHRSLVADRYARLLLPLIVDELHSEQAIDDLRRGAHAVIERKRGSVLRLDIGDVCHRSGVSLDVVERVFDLFSVSSGDKIDLQVGETGALARSRPFLKDGPNLFYAPFPGGERWAIQDRLEELIKSSGDAAWEKYQRHRSSVAVSMVKEAFQKLLPGCDVITNAHYRRNSADAGVSEEVDILITFDCYLIAVEVKASSITPRDMTGGPLRIRGRLQELISKAHGQAIGAVEYVKESEKPVFRAMRLSKTIDKGNTWSLVPISVSLEDIGAITCGLNDLHRTNLSKNQFVPWSVSLSDLQIIAEICPGPAIFLGYLRERMRQVHNDVEKVSDEIDWFGWFLSHGLRFNLPQSQAADMISYSGGSDAIDNWYLFLQGVRTAETEKPLLAGHPRFLDLITSATSEHEFGRFWWAARLFGCDNDHRLEIGRAIDELDTPGMRKSRDASWLFSDGGLSIVTPGELQTDAAVRKALYLASVKKYQAQAPWWLYCVYEPKVRDFVAFGSLNYSWSHDDLLEGEVSKLRSAKTFKRVPRQVYLSELGLQ